MNSYSIRKVRYEELDKHAARFVLLEHFPCVCRYRRMRPAMLSATKKASLSQLT